MNGANQKGGATKASNEFTHVQREMEGRNETFPTFLAAPKVDTEMNTPQG